jgi:hypothetical protein
MKYFLWSSNIFCVRMKYFCVTCVGDVLCDACHELIVVWTIYIYIYIYIWLCQSVVRVLYIYFLFFIFYFLFFIFYFLFFIFYFCSEGIVYGGGIFFLEYRIYFLLLMCLWNIFLCMSYNLFLVFMVVYIVYGIVFRVPIWRPEFCVPKWPPERVPNELFIKVCF